MMLNDIVPFGKYKGRPVAELLADVEYLRWAQTTGVIDKHPWLQVMIVNGAGRADAPTPAHNRLQERFAEPGYCRAVLGLLGVDARPVPPGFDSWKEVEKAAEARRIKKTEHIKSPSIHALDHEWKAYWEKCHAECPAESQLINFASGRDLDVEFEVCGWDVVLECVGIWNFELKPSIGEDYPAVVRQVDRRVALDPRGRGDYGRRHFGSFVIAFDRWECDTPIATVASMYSRFRWLQLPAATLAARSGQASGQDDRAKNGWRP